LNIHLRGNFINLATQCVEKSLFEISILAKSGSDKTMIIFELKFSNLCKRKTNLNKKFSIKDG